MNMCSVEMRKCFKTLSTLITTKRFIFESCKKTKTVLPTLGEVHDGLRKLVGSTIVYSDNEICKYQPELSSYKIECNSELPKVRMHDSYSEAIIPLGSQPHIRDRYVNVYHSVRFGRLLEDLDTMAVLVSYMHNKSQFLKIQDETIAPIWIVTGLVDRIIVKQANIAQKLAIDKDLKITGFTSWAGKTTCEATMKLEQETSPDNWTHILDAKFLMVARDVFNKKSVMMNPLELTTTEEKAIFEVGEKSRVIRKKESQESLFNVPPNQFDSLIIHELFKETIDLKGDSLRRRIKPENAYWMDETKLKSVIICQPEQRNIYNKIFGGFLMRKAYELAWVNSCIFSQEKTEIAFVEHVSFKKPVVIGSLLFLTAQVVYTEGNSIMVNVHAEVQDPLTQKRDVTNEFYYKFIVPHKLAVPRVIPKSYSEAMIYIVGKRHW